MQGKGSFHNKGNFSCPTTYAIAGCNRHFCFRVNCHYRKLRVQSTIDGMGGLGERVLGLLLSAWHLENQFGLIMELETQEFHPAPPPTQLSSSTSLI